MSVRPSPLKSPATPARVRVQDYAGTVRAGPWQRRAQGRAKNVEGIFLESRAPCPQAAPATVIAVGAGPTQEKTGLRPESPNWSDLAAREGSIAFGDGAIQVFDTRCERYLTRSQGGAVRGA